MNSSVILIGVGQMGSVFAKGLSNADYTIVPVARSTNLDKIVADHPNPTAVVVAVGEKDIESVLANFPKVWHDKLVLLQNELLPRDWQVANIESPTVISVWFEKKSGQDVKEIIPSPVYGPLSELIKSSLKTINISTKVLSSPDELLFELVVKNVYILTVNIAGMIVGGTVGELWDKHQEFAKDVAGDVMDIQFKMIEKELDRNALINAMVEAFNGDLDHKCMGRSAPSRLERAITQADEFNLEAAKLREIQEKTSSTTA